MNEPIQRYFRLGTLQWMSYPQEEPLDALKKIAADDFFTAIETKGYGAQNAQAAALLAQSHLTVCYGAHPHQLSSGRNPNAVEEAERLDAQAALLENLEEAASIGATGFAFLSGKWAEETKELAYAQLLRTTRALWSRAAELGIFVELEVFDYDVDKCVLIGPAPLAARFAAYMRLTHQNFGLLVDLSHIPITHETSINVVRTLRPYITHFHYGNAVMRPECDGYGDKHPRFGYPNSENDVAELLDYLRVLRDEGFFCRERPYILSMEVTPRPGEDADVVVANTKRVLQRAWALLDEKS